MKRTYLSWLGAFLFCFIDVRQNCRRRCMLRSFQILFIFFSGGFFFLVLLDRACFWACLLNFITYFKLFLNDLNVSKQVANVWTGAILKLKVENMVDWFNKQTKTRVREREDWVNKMEFVVIDCVFNVVIY